MLCKSSAIDRIDAGGRRFEIGEHAPKLARGERVGDKPVRGGHKAEAGDRRGPQGFAGIDERTRADGDPGADPPLAVPRQRRDRTDALVAVDVLGPRGRPMCREIVRRGDDRHFRGTDAAHDQRRLGRLRDADRQIEHLFDEPRVARAGSELDPDGGKHRQEPSEPRDDQALAETIANCDAAPSEERASARAAEASSRSRWQRA